jgi:hypothetical protein
MIARNREREENRGTKWRQCYTAVKKKKRHITGKRERKENRGTKWRQYNTTGK